MRELKGGERRDGGETGAKRKNEPKAARGLRRRVGRVLLFHFTFITETVEY